MKIPAMITRPLLAAASIVCYSLPARAEVQTLSNVTATVFAQATVGSANDAHVLNVSQNTGVCGNWLYVDFRDKEIFATALSAKLNNKPVSLKFDTSAPPVTIGALGLWFSCKVVSIWIP